MFLIRKQPPEAFRQGGVLGDFAVFTGGTGGGVSILNRAAGLRPVTLLTGRLWSGCFPVGVVGFLGAPVLQSTSGRQLLLIPLSCPLLTLLYFS